MAKKKTALSSGANLISSDTQAQSEGQTQIPTVAPLDSILPDPGQPRRLLPDDLAETVARGIVSPVEAVQEWLRRAESDTAEVALRHNVREAKAIG